jgi:hypothetical protein
MYTTIDQILQIENENEKVIAIGMFCAQRYKSWTETEKLINAIEDLENEVMNGGFSQYYLNSAGIDWQYALIGLEKIEAIQSKNLLEKSFSIFPLSKPYTIREENINVIRNLSTDQNDFLNSLDNEFMAYEDNIGKLVIQYAEKNRNDFGTL